MSEMHPAESDARRQAAMDEVRGRLPGLFYERTRLRESGIEPTGVLLPARLNVPYDGPDATDFKATCMGLPVTWSEGEDWGLIVGLPRVIPPAATPTTNAARPEGDDSSAREGITS